VTGQVLEVDDVITADKLASNISNYWVEWNNLRAPVLRDWEETRKYVYATDTTMTANSTLPWKNKTTLPKLCQIRANLYSNYTATMFPNRFPIEWEANEKDSESAAKRDSIKNYMQWVIDQPSFKYEMGKLVLDYIDYGNCIPTVEWRDDRVEQSNGIQSGYVGPALKRISPTDIVFNPTSVSFEKTPKIIRSIISMGELKDMMQSMSTDMNRETIEGLWDYLKYIRAQAHNYTGDWQQKNNMYSIEGFGSFQQYLRSDYVEILTFYGDYYDRDSDTFQKNRVVTCVDRHKVITDQPNPSYFATAPIFHAAWSVRPDNLWGLGPLANLVGMQYRIDHIENLKADVWDLVTFPVIKTKGMVENFNWQPGEIIRMDNDSDVEVVQPAVQIMQSDSEIQFYMNTMEEMAGAPKEAMGFRTPGEKTRYEVQALENAASRIFQTKIKQFEEQIVERVLNAMLELARRNLTGATTIKVFDDDLKAATFKTLTVDDISGIGRIKPVAARHFAEQAQLVQNLTSLAQSNLWPIVQPHISGVKLAKMFEKNFNMEQEEIVLPYVALAEQADAQRMQQALQEQTLQQTTTASGMGDDYDLQPSLAQMQPQPNAPVQGP
jgi:hypothetical protein